MLQRLTATILLFLPCAARAQTPEPPRYADFAAQIDGLLEPTAAAIDASGRIWVVESFRHRVRVFDARGGEQTQWNFGAYGSRANELIDPQGIAVAPDGVVYVSDSGNDRIQAFFGVEPYTHAFGRRGAGVGELGEPVGLTATADKIYVCESRNARVQVFDRSGKSLATIGKPGRGDGELDHPRDVAVDSTGAVYVADTGNQRVVKFDASGKYVKSWGGFGPYAGLFQAPSGIECARDRIYVADRDNHRVQVFDTKGELVYDWGTHALRPHEGHGRLHYANGIAIAPAGDFAVVVEGFEDRVQVFKPQTERVDPGAPMERNTAAHYAGGCTVVGPLFALLEPSGPSIQIFDLVQNKTPIEISRFGIGGTGFGRLMDPIDLVLDEKAETLLVSDAGNARLSLFDVKRVPSPEMKYEPYLAQFTRSIDLTRLANVPAATWPVEPGAIARGVDGELFVVDRANARVLVLDAQWNVKRTFARFGANPGELMMPTGIAVAPEGSPIYVADARARVVQMFNRGGSSFGELGDRPIPAPPAGIIDPTHDVDFNFVRPFGVAIGKEGHVIVSDEGCDQVFLFESGLNSPYNRPLRRFGQRGIGKLEFMKPHGISADGHGKLFVVDRGNHRYQILSEEGEYLDMMGARLYMNAANEKK